MVIADNEISEDQREISAPKSPWKRHSVDEKSVDVPVLVVGTKSWPALSDAQTPKPKNHVEKVSAKGEDVAVSVPSVGQVAPRAPSVQKSNGSGNFNPMNKMPSPHYQKPGPKRNSNKNGTPHFPVATMPYHQQPPVAPYFRPMAPPPHIAVPAYAFPPGSEPYPNGENPKPVSPVAAGQGFTPPAHAIDAKHVQPPVQGDPNAYAVNYPNGRPNSQEQGDHVSHGLHHQRPFPSRANMPMQHGMGPSPIISGPPPRYMDGPSFPESMEGRKIIQLALHQIDLNEPVSVQDPSEHSMEQQQEKTGTDIIESGRAVAILNSNDNNAATLNSNENNLIQAESVPEESHAPRKWHWTEDEHKLFLKGLKKHGKGRWKDISKEFVVTKTPIQVASHAQKYFIHQNVNDIEKRKKRRSIHGTTLNKNDTSVTEIPSFEQQNELTPLVTAPMEEQHEIPPLVTPTMEQHENPPQDTATSRQMYQLVLLCPISSTLPNMNNDTLVTEIPSVEQQNDLTPLVIAPMEEQHEIPPQDTATSRQMYQLVLLCPIGSTLPDMNKLEKMRNLLAKEL